MNEKKRSLMATSSGAMEKQGIGGVEQQQPQLALKCPRCDSSNTKFCYYNNYSLSQPRHFCKACKRYWTRGGTLRNVPVGGGCRKNKRVKIRPPITITTGSKDQLPSTNNRIVNPIFSASAHHQLGFSSAGQLLINGGEVNYYSSSSSSCLSMTSLLASTIQHQKLISGGDLELKDDYSSLKPLLCPIVQNGSGLALAAMNKVNGEMNYNMINPVGGNGWNNNYIGYQNHEEMEVIGLSSSHDPNYYWSMSNATPSNNWHHPPTNANEPSLPSLI